MTAILPLLPACVASWSSGASWQGRRWWWWCLWVDVGIWWITDGRSGMMLVMCMVWEIHGIWRCLLMDLRPSSLLGEVLMVCRKVCLGWQQSFGSLGLPQPPHYLDTWTLALSAMTWQRVSLAPHGLSRQLDHTSALEVLKYNIYQKYIVWRIDTIIIIIITNIASVQEGFTIPTIWWTWLHIGRKNYCPTTWPSETSSSFFYRIIFKSYLIILMFWKLWVDHPLDKLSTAQSVLRVLPATI